MMLDVSQRLSLTNLNRRLRRQVTSSFKCWTQTSRKKASSRVWNPCQSSGEKGGIRRISGNRTGFASLWHQMISTGIALA